MGGYNEIFDDSSLTSNPPLWPTFCSLYRNDLGPEGGKAIAEALNVNRSIVQIEYARIRLVYDPLWGAIMGYLMTHH